MALPNHVRMPFGKWNGTLVCDLPDGYLCWLHTLEDLRNSTLKSAIDQEFDHRFNDFSEDDSKGAPISLLPPPVSVKDIVDAGFRALALRIHPDVGGTNNGMRILLEGRQWLYNVIQMSTAKEHSET